MAAGIVIVREAGGIATDLQGTDKMLDKGDVIAGNGHMVKAMRNLVTATA
jgi:myo-inositol-1(or 4)-monophosphatase